MLPANKQIAFFSDAYCVDWLYVKSKLVRAELAKAMAMRMERRQYSFDTAIEIACKLLNPSSSFVVGGGKMSSHFTRT